MTKEIVLTNGAIALVDDEDYARLSGHVWYFDGRSYARRAWLVGGKRHQIRMHQEVLQVEDGYFIDHINGNGLDNRKSNLRPATHMQNMRNRKPNEVSSSIYRGVYFHRQAGKWRARLRTKGLHLSLGLYQNQVDAARAYDAAARRVFGEFARLNLPEEA